MLSSDVSVELEVLAILLKLSLWVLSSSSDIRRSSIESSLLFVALSFFWLLSVSFLVVSSFSELSLSLSDCVGEEGS